jgi:hypothetical protein
LQNRIASRGYAKQIINRGAASNKQTNFQNKQKFAIMFYISKTKAAFNPANTNTPDTFVSRGYDTREEAAEALEVIEAINTMLAEKSDLCVIQHDPNKMPTQRLRQQ